MTVTVAIPPGFSIDGANAQLVPAGIPEHARAIWLLNPLESLACTVTAPEDPRATDKACCDRVSEKSGIIEVTGICNAAINTGVPPRFPKSPLGCSLPGRRGDSPAAPSTRLRDNRTWHKHIRARCKFPPPTYSWPRGHTGRSSLAIPYTLARMPVVMPGSAFCKNFVRGEST